MTSRASHLAFQAEVDGVDEAAGDRQVGRGGHGAGGLGRVQGVDEEEVGALIAQEADQRGQVVGVAHPPRAARAGGVELGHDAPAALAQRGGQVEVVGGDGQGGGDGARRRRTAPAGPAGPLVPVDRADLGDELVPAQRQVGGDDEGRLPGAHAVDHAGPRPVLGLRQLALTPVLQLHAQAQRGAVGRVDDDGALDPAPHDDGGRQGAAPGGAPRARRTATRVSREGEARLPWKSQYSVEMPWASASCLRRSPAGSDAERESVIAGTAL